MCLLIQSLSDKNKWESWMVNNLHLYHFLKTASIPSSFTGLSFQFSSIIPTQQYGYMYLFFIEWQKPTCQTHLLMFSEAVGDGQNATEGMEGLIILFVA